MELEMTPERAPPVEPVCSTGGARSGAPGRQVLWLIGDSEAFDLNLLIDV